MPAIRWLGYAGEFKGIDSFKWEFSNTLEVSAEWTIKGRSFVIPTKIDGVLGPRGIIFGLLVASKAINRRFRCDGASGRSKQRKKIPWEWRTKTLDETLFNIKPWECLCNPIYKAVVIVSPTDDAKIYLAKCASNLHNEICGNLLPLLILQADTLIKL